MSLGKCKPNAPEMEFMILSKDNTTEALEFLGDKEDDSEIPVGSYLIRDPEGRTFSAQEEDFNRIFEVTKEYLNV